MARSARSLPGAGDYYSGSATFLEGLLPPDALRLDVPTVVELLRARLGDQVDAILEGVAPTVPAPRDASWLTSTRMVGINVRTIGSFWRVLHYLLTVPACYDSVHLLPIWEPGVVGSLYGIASWEINPEFCDDELVRHYPHLATAEQQLRAVVALMRASGRRVGVDVIPHTDRYSEIVLAQPHYFEWLRRRGTRIVDHADSLHLAVMEEIGAWLRAEGPACDEPTLPPSERFWIDLSERQRQRALFGEPDDHGARLARRERLISRLHHAGYEPVPATMAPPYRGITVDPTARYRDAAGRRWYDYRIVRPQPMSRVFGPLTRYKFYGRLNDNRHWEIDFDSPRAEVFEYLATHILNVVERYGFDFMRGDMSHVQMRPEGPPLEPDAFYDPLRYVKLRVGARHPSFAYFAETFLAPPNTMAYGNEIDHLEASEADVTLGDLQSIAVGDAAFLPTLRRYLDIATTRRVVPAFTVMTGDKDDPRFDSFYREGNEARMLLSLFLPTLPSYVALGFELRDRHDRPAANEFYTKLYVFQESRGPKATSGPYRFGNNVELFATIGRMRRLADELLPVLRFDRAQWIVPPDPTAVQRCLAWTLDTTDAACLFVANTASSVASTTTFALEGRGGRLVFSSLPGDIPRTEASIAPAGQPGKRSAAGAVRLTLGGGEARVYRLDSVGMTSGESP